MFGFAFTECENWDLGRLILFGAYTESNIISTDQREANLDSFVFHYLLKAKGKTMPELT